MHYELKNVQNALDIILKNILKFRNNRFYKNFYSKNCRILIFFSIHCLVIFAGRINIENTSENIKYGNS